MMAVAVFLAGCAGGSGGTLKKQNETVEICLNGECGPAAGRFSKEELIGGLLVLLKANENTEIILCDSDPKTDECVRDGISFFVQGAPIPGVSNYGNMYLTHVGLDKKSFQIKYTMAATVTWIGTPVLCQDQYTEVTVKSVNDILIESPGFVCTWTILPHRWNAQYAVSKIDFDNSVITGNYAIGGAGLLVAGGGDGSFTMKFSKKNTLASSGGGTQASTSSLRAVGQLPSRVLAAPVPTPDDVAVSTGTFDLEERGLWESVSNDNKAGGYGKYLELYPEGRFAGAARSKLRVVALLDSQNQELADWSRIKGSTDASDFDKFAARYPGGLYVEVATIRGRRLRAVSAEAAALDAELTLWEQIKGSASIDEIEAYLKKYPGGQFAGLAKNRIGNLTKAATNPNDIELTQWGSIKGSRDIRDYQNFLQAFPAGIFADIAKGRIQNLNELTVQTADLDFWNRVKDSGKLADFSEYLRRYPEGQFADLARTLMQQVAALQEGRRELAMWEAAQSSASPAKYDAYLSRYPGGRFVLEAKLAKQKSEREMSLGDIDFGRFHALVIGNNNYQKLPDLVTAIADAKAVSEVLKSGYGFVVTLLLDATESDVFRALQKFRNTMTADDSLLIYYAGHGILDEEADRGYWLPVDADPDFKADWISNADLTDALKTFSSDHVMVVADSCYSGALARGISAKAASSGNQRKLFKRLFGKRSRTVLTSGGLEPVSDGGGGKHSVFAKAFLQALRENPGVILGQQVFSQLRASVVVNADQTPEYSDVRKAGHDGGDFIFVRKN